MVSGKESKTVIEAHRIMELTRSDELILSDTTSYERVARNLVYEID